VSPAGIPIPSSRCFLELQTVELVLPAGIGGLPKSCRAGRHRGESVQSGQFCCAVNRGDWRPALGRVDRRGGLWTRPFRVRLTEHPVAPVARDSVAGRGRCNSTTRPRRWRDTPLCFDASWWITTAPRLPALPSNCACGPARISSAAGSVVAADRSSRQFRRKRVSKIETAQVPPRRRRASSLSSR